MDLNNKKVLVIGLARSGMAAIKVLKRLGAVITLSEAKKKEDIKESDFLLENGVEVRDQSMAVFEEDYALAVKNPGVPFNSPMIKRLEERGIPVITEIELAFRVSKKQNYIALTGTNGKTTTTTLVYEILRRAYGEKAHLCGNIGIPLCEIVLSEGLMEEEGHHIALEISNFQLVNIRSFCPDAATIINMTPDHVDFMGSLEAYYKSKTDIYKNMSGEQIFLLNADDCNVREYTEKYPVGCRTVTYSLERDDCDCLIKDGYIQILGEKVIPLSCIRLVGRHNLQNVMTAVALTKLQGIDNSLIEDAVSQFAGVEHRIEFVREKKGVKYYNDSKGTNTDATITALQAFEKGVILLVGGFEKGLSMEEMKKHLGCVKRVIGYGACGKRLAGELAGEEGIVVTTLDEAVAAAYGLAAEGDTVLLSPTTSSFDQYSCFEERGDHFKRLVMAL